jgi:propanol-preferring alcohol dehydrogenase
MRAVIYDGNGLLALTEQPDPVAPTDGGLLAVEGSGVCIADGEVVRGLGGPAHRPPIILGHEIVGRVLAAGPDAPGLARLVGHRVLVDDARPCGTCAFCVRDAPRCCRSPHYGHIGHQPGTGWGGYGQLLTLDRLSNLHPVTDDVPLERATFSFPLASGIEWTHRLAGLAPGETVAVVGHSRMGVASVAAASLKQPGRIAVYGHPGGDAAVRAVAALGADVVDDTDHPAAGFDVVVVVTEASAAEAALGLELAGTLGRVVLASCAMEPIAVEPESIRKRGLTVRGGRGHTAPSLDEAIAALTTHADWFNADYFERFDLDDAQKALETMHDERGVAVGTHRVLAAWPD